MSMYQTEDFEEEVIFGCDSADHCADRANDIHEERCPYRKELDDLKNHFTENSLRGENARLREALEQICHPNMRPDGPADGAIRIARAALKEGK